MRPGGVLSVGNNRTNTFMKRHFTLVEVLIAMGVCVVGVCSIMALFPVGLANSRDAGMAGQASTTADQMLHLMKAVIVNTKNTDGTDVTEAQAETRFLTLTGFSHFASGIVAADGQSKPLPDKDDEVGLTWTPVTTATPGLGGMVGKLITTNDLTVSTCATPGVYWVERGGTMGDMECIVRIWAEPVAIPMTSSKGGVAYLPRTARFHAEVSWPAQKDYDKRLKLEYTMDVYCPPRS